MDYSPLSRLPAELRNYIYELVCVTDNPIIISFRYFWDPPMLLQTCRQLRAEAAPIYYGDNIFHAEEGQLSTLGSLEMWLRTIGEEARRLIRTIHFSHLDAYFNVFSVEDAKHESRCCEELMKINGVVVPEGSISLPYFEGVVDPSLGEQLWASAK